MFLDTPVQQIHTEFIRSSKVEVFMKRDDLIHPFISGNKWRKLKYNIEAFKSQDKKMIVTFGGAFSNHLIATAAACAQQSISCLGIVRGDELNRNSNYVLRLCEEFGMKLQFVSRDEYRDKGLLEEKWKEKDCFVIPEGGDNENGRRGCEEIVPAYTSYDHVVVSVGTGTTFSGIIQASNGCSHIHGMSAVGNGAYLNSVVNDYVQHSNWTLHTNYAYGGFGKCDKEQSDFNTRFTRETGILLDPVYTGKMIRGLYHMIEVGEIKSGERVLCIHTGGLTGLLSERWLNS